MSSATFGRACPTGGSVACEEKERVARARSLWGVLGAFVLGVLLPAGAEAQLTDLAELSGTHHSGSRLGDAAPSETQLSSYDLSLKLPLPVAARSYLIPGASYHVDSVQRGGMSRQVGPLRSFHAVDASLLYVQFLPEEWTLVVRLTAGLAGDFATVDRGLVRWSLMALGTKALSERTTVGGGMLALWSFGTLLPLPAVYLDWRPSPRWQLEVFVPAFANLTYTHAERFEVGARVEVSGQSYAVRDERVAQDWRCSAAQQDDPTTLMVDESRPLPGQCVDHITYTLGVAGLHLGVRLFSSVWLTALVGGSFHRRLEARNEHDRAIAGGTESLPGSFVFRAALTWRLPETV